MPERWRPDRRLRRALSIRPAPLRRTAPGCPGVCAPRARAGVRCPSPQPPWAAARSPTARRSRFPSPSEVASARPPPCRTEMPSAPPSLPRSCGQADPSHARPPGGWGPGMPYRRWSHRSRGSKLSLASRRVVADSLHHYLGLNRNHPRRAELREPVSAELRNSLEGRVVDPYETETRPVPHRPLEVVEQRPYEVADDVGPAFAGIERGREMVAQVLGALMIDHDRP